MNLTLPPPLPRLSRLTRFLLLLLLPALRDCAPSPWDPDPHPTLVPLTPVCLCPAERVLEKSLHRSVLKPLRPTLLARLQRRLSADGSLGRLAEGLRLARAQGPGAFGSQLSLPSPVEMEQVRQKLLQLLRAYSPSAQVKRLLQACKLLYTVLRTHWGASPPTASHWLLAVGSASRADSRTGPTAEKMGATLPSHRWST